MYTMTGVKALNSGAWEGTIRFNGNIEGRVKNDGNGGCSDFQWTKVENDYCFQMWAEKWNAQRPVPTTFEIADAFALWLSVEAQGMTADEFECEMAF